tara:strand:- start:5498 stop:6019 length:522 start_codon:yes stop_codon:yes gene_type:complete
MKLEKIAVAELKFDSNNARKHDKANLEAIAGSLLQFGQRKPIVITQDNSVVAGNGTLTAAKTLGWETIEAVRVPKEWTPNQIKAFALADNRTSELAAWNKEIMASQLLELQEADFEIEAFGFVPVEQAKEADVKEYEWVSRYEVIVECEDEFQQQEILLRLQEQGYQVRALIV